MNNNGATKQEIESLIRKIDNTILFYRTDFRETKIRSNGMDEYKELASLMGLPQNGFVKVPLFLGQDDDNIINVCSLCFSALTLVYSTKSLQNKSEIDLIYSIINTLIFLHLHKTGVNGKEFVFWPSSYNIGQSQKETGTIDQTTSCLSLLYKVGFLDRQSSVLKASITEDAYIERLRFVKKSIEWLLHLQVTNNGNTGGWPYSDKCVTEDNRVIHAAVLPTYFCIKTLRKYIEIFKKDDWTKQYIDSFNDALINRMDEAVGRGIDFLCLHQHRSDGGISISSEDNEKSSYIHSILALDSLLNDARPHQYEIERYLLYLTNKAPKHTFKSIDKNAFESFKYEKHFYLLSEEHPYEDGTEKPRWHETYQLERFEWFIEAMIIITYITLKERTESITNNSKTRCAIRKFEKLACISYKSMLDRITEDQKGILVKGRRHNENEQYPMYCVYDTKIVLCKLVSNPLLLQRLVTDSLIPKLF